MPGHVQPRPQADAQAAVTLHKASRILSGLTGPKRPGLESLEDSPKSSRSQHSRTSTPRKLREYADVAKSRLDRVVQVCGCLSI